MIEKNWKELIKPSKIDVQSSDDKKISKIIVEPLERGFALTLGNALRRVLLVINSRYSCDSYSDRWCAT